MRLRLAGVVVAVVLFGSVAGWSATIGLFSDVDCGSCNLSLESGQVGTIYIKADLTGVWFPRDGLGAEFRVEGLPAGWFVLSATPNPGASVVAGDPFGSGVRMCCGMTGPDGCLTLYTVVLAAGTSVQDVVLRIVPATSPSFGLTCPQLFHDALPLDPPAVCADGGVLFVNSGTDCTVPVKASTWSTIKRLFG